MRKLVLALSVAGFVAAQCAVLSAQISGGGDMSQCPMMEHGKDSHHAAMEMHGDEAMGFAHDKTTHHFLMAQSGGVIEVKANDPGDNASVAAIRSHLAHIATMFKSGDFSAPMFVHSTIPPGVTAMKLLKKKIRYTYEPLDAGGRVRIESSDPVAVAAVQDFLRFQITDHQTDDPLTDAGAGL
jgi:hypothetical protein